MEKETKTNNKKIENVIIVLLIFGFIFCINCVRKNFGYNFTYSELEGIRCKSHMSRNDGFNTYIDVTITNMTDRRVGSVEVEYEYCTTDGSIETMSWNYDVNIRPGHSRTPESDCPLADFDYLIRCEVISASN